MAVPRRRRRSPLAVLELRAYHEAGHAVVACLRGFTVTQLTISRRGRIGGACGYQFRRPGGPRGGLRRTARAGAAVALAGSVAQDVAMLERGFLALDAATGRPFPLFTAGAQDDERVAMRFAGFLYRGRAARRAFLQRMRASTERLLARRESWEAVRRLAGVLRRERTLAGDRAAESVARAVGSTVAGRRPRRRP